MEDGDTSEMEVSASIKSAETNVLLNKMANYPDVEVTVTKNNTDCNSKTSDSPTKVNGEPERINSNSDELDDFTSDEDALIIDEDCKSVETKPALNHKRLRSPSPRANFKGFKKRIIAKSFHCLKITNEIKKTYHLDDRVFETVNHKEEPNIQGELNDTITKDSITPCLLNDSDIRTGTSDLCTLTDQKPKKSLTAASTHIESLKHKQHVTAPSLKSSGKRPVKKRLSQKLTEYAQYLGLQPAVKFKCVKCSESCFPSLSALNEHQRQCLVQPHSATKPPTAAVAPTPATGPSASTATSTSTNFRITRKVFLCSSCGTYYENCNLFLHMREVHRRYICLFCLGMFSLPEKLSHHLITKHNCSPNHYLTAEDFLNSYRESCFLVCCHCERVFSERDNFSNHVCIEKRATLTEKSCWSCGIKGSSAHLATCRAAVEQPPSTSTHNQKPNNKSIHPKSQKHKATKNHQKSIVAPPPVQHVTADDSPSSTSLLSNDLENEDDKTGGHFLADMSSCENILPEDSTTLLPNKSEASSIENTDLNENSTKNITTEMETNEKLDFTDKILDEATNDTENKQNDDLTNLSNSIENVICNKSIHEDLDETKSDNEEKILQENCDLKTELVSEPEENHSDVENVQTEPEDLKILDKDTSETNTLQSSQENNDTYQNFENENDFTKNETEESSEHAAKTDNENDSKESIEYTIVEETRKVPKVTLKLSLPHRSLNYSENESDDSEKLMMEVDENYDSDNDCEESLEHSKSFNESERTVNGIDDNEKNNSDLNLSDDDSFQVAGEDVSVVELELDQPLDKFSIENLIKTCLGTTIPTCIYCNHARKIAVNGKQLGLHAIAEHRFAATVNSITAEELIPKNFVQRIKESLDEIELVYFSLEEPEKVVEEIKEDGLHVSTFKRLYECFQCRFITTIHKELYLHNRKMHAKTILLCIMCKSNFYSYSELICHLCPGNYILNSETNFRCCMCESSDLPSAFRLMVHLRKRHHTCDVCLEGCHNQSKLSNHVWKHKLHHLCYRCGIAYRNKPDITKHLFWKHGTESVLCKKCLQKKWPHVYHFCVPPLSFVCEECNFSFSRAVYLKVHKRLHNNEKPHACTEENCSEIFISKKLLLKHEIQHREPIPIENIIEPVVETKENIKVENEIEPKPENVVIKEATEPVKEESNGKVPSSPEREEVKQKNIIDVYDLPALNLSESDSDSEEEKPKPATSTTQSDEKMKIDEKPEDLPNSFPATTESLETPLEDYQKPVPILDGIWDNFKNYQATIEKSILNPDLTNKDNTQQTEKDEPEVEENKPDINVILADHDYCLPETTRDTLESEDIIMKADEATGLDHDYCTVISNVRKTNQPSSSTSRDDKPTTTPEPRNPDKKKVKTKKKSSSSESSSGSDSSSCTCGSNCSCSSSSGSSSSSSSSSDSDSSSSEGKRRVAARRERRKERAKRKKESETSHITNTSAVDVVATEDPPVFIAPIELPILESDLETDETETDEDFYDEHPQRLANKLLAEKRNQLALLASVAPVSNGTILECSRPSTPSIPEEVSVTKKKIKSKKKKKKSRSSTPKQEIRPHLHIPAYMNNHLPVPVQSTLPIAPVIHSQVPSPLSVHSLPSTHLVSTPSLPLPPKSQLLPPHTPGSGSETETSVRSSKRRRVPNKFYGYSSDEEGNEKLTPTIPVLKWRKSDLPTPPSHVTGSPQLVPPITIKNIPSPAPIVEPVRPAPVIVHHKQVSVPESDSETEEVHHQHQKSTTDSSDDNRNDDSDSDAGQLHISQPQPQLQHHPPPFPSATHHHHQKGGLMMQGERSNENLYCYCQCPYDEVSEMIACDGRECAIEWFHFECVGIMVPPKGKWYCPDCRRKNSQRSEFIQT